MAGWFLDLCFKQKLCSVGAGHHLHSFCRPEDVLVCWLEPNPSKGPPSAMTFDPSNLRVAVSASLHAVPGMTERGRHVRTEVGVGGSAHGLFGLRDVDMRFTVPFRVHHSLRMPVHPTRPIYAGFLSIGSLNNDELTVLYVPPLTLEFVAAKTPSGHQLPTEPTLYKSIDEASFVPALLELWGKDDDLSKDCAVLLECNGPDALPRARAVIASERDKQRGLPQLVGSLKQIAWASHLRENFVAEHLPWKKQQTVMQPWLAGKTTLKGVKAVVAELRYADVAAEWIEHRESLFEWLERRVESRKQTFRDNPGLKDILPD